MFRRLQQWWQGRHLPRNRQLRRALARAARESDPAAHAAVASAFVASTLLLAADDAARGELAFKIVKDEQGAVLLPAFTHQRAFLDWYATGGDFVALGARQVVGLMREHQVDGLALNPAGPLWARFSCNDLLAFCGEPPMQKKRRPRPRKGRSGTAPTSG